MVGKNKYSGVRRQDADADDRGVAMLKSVIAGQAATSVGLHGSNR